jgi:site-specific DNA-methyltransferase (adenine-specific)
VICDLPYGTTACAWDSVIPFDKLWEQYKRICKPNAAIVLFGSEPFSTMLRMSNLKEYRYDWIWDKVQGSNFMNATKRPMMSHEVISVFYKEFGTYNPQPRKLSAETVARNKRHFPDKAYEARTYGASFVRDHEKYAGQLYGHPKSIITFSKETNNQFVKNKTFHPTQKPVDLLRYLVLTYTNEGDTVLDNCMGSGTTAIACIKEHRHFIGFELSKEYFDKAVRRIKAEQAQLTLF